MLRSQKRRQPLDGNKFNLVAEAFFDQFRHCQKMFISFGPWQGLDQQVDIAVATSFIACYEPNSESRCTPQCADLWPGTATSFSIACSRVSETVAIQSPSLTTTCLLRQCVPSNSIIPSCIVPV